MNPSNTGLLKMLPGYLRLSDPGDQIGMLLRQSRSTHPLFACDVFDRVCRGIPCIIQLQMYTLNSCWYVGSRAVRRPIWTVFFSPLPPFRTITWRFNATCQLVYSHRLQYNACFLRLVQVFNFYYLSYLGLKATFIFYRGGTFLLGCIGLWAFVRPMRSYQCVPDTFSVLLFWQRVARCMCNVFLTGPLLRLSGEAEGNVVLWLKIRSGSKCCKGGSINHHRHALGQDT